MEAMEAEMTCAPIDQNDGPPAVVHVLIADPDPAVLNGYLHLDQGFTLEMVSSGQGCMASLGRRTPDVLILEPALPAGDSADVLAHISRTPACHSLPVMIITSCREVDVFSAIAPYRISDYRAKPVSCDELAVRIRNVLRYRDERDAAEVNPRHNEMATPSLCGDRQATPN